MKHLQLFELFNFSKGDWKQKIDSIYNEFLKLKKEERKIFYNINISIDDEDNDFNIMSGEIQLIFQKNPLQVSVINWDTGHDKEDEKDYKIKLSDYNIYLKKVKEINDWLDKQSEEEVESRQSKVGKSGEINLNYEESDLALDEFNDKVKGKYLNQYIGKSFEFKLQYYLWTSASSNELENITTELKVDDIEIIIKPGLRTHIDVHVKDPVRKMDSILRVYDDDEPKCEYFDFSKHKLPDIKKIFQLHIADSLKGKSRKTEREKWKNMKYPYIMSYEITPSKYDTIEFLKFLVEMVNIIEGNRN